MDLPAPLIFVTFLRRYKRFLADFQAPDGATITAHCANSGSMLGLLHPGTPAMLSCSDNPQRKLAYTWELAWENNTWVGIHTGRTNAIVHEALALKALPALQDYGKIQPEVAVGEKSRLDFRLDGENLPPCFLEVKSVTLRQGDEAAPREQTTASPCTGSNPLARTVTETPATDWRVPSWSRTLSWPSRRPVGTRPRPSAIPWACRLSVAHGSEEPP